LHDDGNRHAGLLYGHVIEVIRRRDSQHAQQEALDQIAARKSDPPPATPAHQNDRQHQQRERGASLRKDERIDGMQALPANWEPAGKNGAAQRGGNSPEKGRRGNEQISAPGVRGAPVGFRKTQSFVTGTAFLASSRC
jgi:hypothetical protein